VLNGEIMVPKARLSWESRGLMLITTNPQQTLW
jgi:hypothetical protein